MQVVLMATNQCARLCLWLCWASVPAAGVVLSVDVHSLCTKTVRNGQNLVLVALNYIACLELDRC